MKNLDLKCLKLKGEKGLKTKNQNKKLCKQVHFLIGEHGKIDHEMLDEIDEQLNSAANKDHDLKEIL